MCILSHVWVCMQVWVCNLSLTTEFVVYSVTFSLCSRPQFPLALDRSHVNPFSGHSDVIGAHIRMVLKSQVVSVPVLTSPAVLCLNQTCKPDWKLKLLFSSGRMYCRAVACEEEGQGQLAKVVKKRYREVAQLLASLRVRVDYNTWVPPSVRNSQARILELDLFLPQEVFPS